MHKRAIQDPSNNNSALNGNVIRSVGGGSSYDVIFTPLAEEDFSRSPPNSLGEALNEAALQADFNTIEEFFVHFHNGIITRVEEAITR